MITIKMSELLDSTEVLQKLAKTSLKAKLAFQIARVLKEAEKEVQGFNDTRMNLIKKYGEKDEGGELVKDENDNCKIPNESIKEFQDELNEVMNTEIEINANKLRMEDLESLDFTPSEMAMLEPFIEFDE